MDAWVLGFTFLVAVLTSLLSGTAPALAARESVVGTLKEGGAQSTIGRGKHRMRSLLIVAQVAVSFLADVELRLAVAGVPSPGTQSYITAQVPALPESMRIVHRQHVRQRDQRSDTIDLLQLGYLRVVLLRDLFDLMVIVLDSLGQRLYFLKQWFQSGSQFGT